MRLIALVDATYYDAYNQAILVPSGVSGVSVEFQANDSSLGDNSGSIAFKVTVCNQAPASFTHDFDFGNGPLLWAGVTAASVTPTWDGTQWQSADFVSGGCGGSNLATQNQITRAMPATRYVRSIRVVGVTDTDNGSGNGSREIVIDGGSPISLGINATAGAFDVTIPINQDVDTSIEVRLNSICFASQPNTQITRIVVSGDGSDPF